MSVIVMKVVALDFLSGFAEGFEAAAVQYLNNENIPDILNELMKVRLAMG